MITSWDWLSRSPKLQSASEPNTGPSWSPETDELFQRAITGNLVVPVTIKFVTEKDFPRMPPNQIAACILRPIVSCSLRQLSGLTLRYTLVEFLVRIAPYSSPNQEWQDWCTTMAHLSPVTEVTLTWTSTPSTE